ncbi:MAG: NAD(P)H-binding protein [Nakamurella sp.]
MTRVRALVVGSSGYVGSRLVAHLVRQGHDVVASARNVDKLGQFGFSDTVETLELDVTDRVSCRRALEAAGPLDVAYYLVHSIGGDDFAERDRRSADTFANAATRAHVSRIVYLGGLVPAGEDLSEHLESRAEVGDTLTETLTDDTDPGPGDVVWLRAAVILGAGSTSFEVVRSMAERLPVVPLPRFMFGAVSPIAVDDVLHYLIAAGDPAAVPAGSYDISNGEPMTYADLIKLYARSSGLRRWWVSVPFVTPRLAAPIVAALTPIPRDLVRDLVESLGNTMVSQDDRIRRLVADPVDGLTTAADAIRRAAVVEGGFPTVWDSLDSLRLAETDPGWAGGRLRA